MTARDYLNIRLHRARNIFYSGAAVGVGTMAILVAMANMATMPTAEWFLFTFVGGGLAVIIIADAADRYGRSTVRCPSCWGELYSLTNHGPLQRSFSLAHAKFCLHCGKLLDDELPIGGQPGNSTAKVTPLLDELA